MSDDLPLMPKATAVWLVDNTTLTFRQIAEFCGMHELEVSGIADGEVAQGIKGFDPILNHQLTAKDIERCEGDTLGRLRLIRRQVAPPPKRKVPRYTPVSKRQDRPAAIAWLVRYHPEMENVQIAKLVGSTKPTIESIRNRSHWNISNIQPVDPVALGLCRQIDLDAAVQKAIAKREKLAGPVPTPEERISLMSTDESLAPAAAAEAPVNPFGEDTPVEAPAEAPVDYDPDALFNLPKGSGGDEENEAEEKR